MYVGVEGGAGTRTARTDELGRESEVGGSDRDVGGGGRRGRRLE